MLGNLLDKALFTGLYNTVRLRNRNQRGLQQSGVQELTDERFYVYGNLALNDDALALDDVKDKIELLRVRTDGFRHFWFKSTVESFF